MQPEKESVKEPEGPLAAFFDSTHCLLRAQPRYLNKIRLLNVAFTSREGTSKSLTF